MELALYCPECGFYERDEDRVGRGGDFITSASVGPLFGELLAFQCRRWWRAAETPRLRLVEAGAHGGRFAADVLNWFQLRHPREAADRVRYAVLEPSARREQWQRRRLALFGGRVEWWRHWPVATDADEFAVILSNELLDAMPLRRFGWDAVARRWFEWGVRGGPERFEWARLPLAQAAAELDLPAEPAAALPDGFTVERGFAAEAWWTSAAAWLRRGRLLTFDYGDWMGEPPQPERPAGTLRSYRRHRVGADALADPGEQDLTAHVDFRRIAMAGERTGLVTEEFAAQGRWLARLGAEALNAEAEFGEWTPSHTRQFQTLTHPDHFGRRFKVLAQARR